jgi:hypothetical protein
MISITIENENKIIGAILACKFKNIKPVPKRNPNACPKDSIAKQLTKNDELVLTSI